MNADRVAVDVDARERAQLAAGLEHRALGRAPDDQRAVAGRLAQRRVVARDRGRAGRASGAGPGGATFTLILSVSDSPSVVSPTASSSWYSSPLKSGRTS